MDGKQIIKKYLMDIKVLYTSSSLHYEAEIQPENANGADTLQHELQERYYQHSEVSSIVLSIMMLTTKNIPYL